MYRAAWPSGKLSKCVRWTVGHSWVWRTSLNNGTLSTFCRISVGPAQARVLSMEISGSVWLVWTGRVQGNTPAILPVQICTNGQMKVYLSTGVWIRCSPPTVYVCAELRIFIIIYTSWSNRNWYFDEPSCGGEACVVMYHQPTAQVGLGGPYLYQWNDDRCNMKHNFICKYEPGMVRQHENDNTVWKSCRETTHAGEHIKDALFI